MLKIESTIIVSQITESTANGLIQQQNLKKYMETKTKEGWFFHENTDSPYVISYRNAKPTTAKQAVQNDYIFLIGLDKTTICYQLLSAEAAGVEPARV